MTDKQLAAILSVYSKRLGEAISEAPDKVPLSMRDFYLSIENVYLRMVEFQEILLKEGSE